MALVLPPPPIGEPPGSLAWQQWYLALTALYGTTGAIPWATIDTAGSNITDIATRPHNSLTTIQGGAANDYYHLTSAQQTIIAAGLASGTYTPTLTNTTNLDASTAYQCQYIQVGATVVVSGKVDVDPTAAVSTVLGISLPVASNLGAVEDLCGSAAASGIAGQSAALLGDATNNRATMEWIAINLTNQPMYFTFVYQVI